MPRPSSLEALLSHRILVLDGAMGTLLQQRGFAGNFDHLSIVRPEVVSAVHHEYLEAGSDIIQTNTFNSTTLVQADFGLASMVGALNVAASRLARAACDAWTARTPDRRRFVAGTIGPTNRSVSIASGGSHPIFREVAFDRLKDAYREQARALIDGGCDLLLVETVFDMANATAAIAAIEEVYAEGARRLPLMVSATISGESGRTPGGQSIEDCWAAIAHATPLAVGLNCSAGAPAMGPHLETLARVADCAVSCHPSAGLPDAGGVYPERPADTAAALRAFAIRGLLNIVGGCCGTTPPHIKALAEAVRDLPPRTRPRVGRRHAPFWARSDQFGTRRH